MLMLIIIIIIIIIIIAFVLVFKWLKWLTIYSCMFISILLYDNVKYTIIIR